MEELWKFTDNLGSFESREAHRVKGLYFPLANEALLSSITPDLHGDIKASQNSFLLTPVSRIDLADSRSSRNFWIYVNKNKIWSACGVSKNLEQINNAKSLLNAGLLWHKIERENKVIGLRAGIISFIPASGEPVEIMLVTLKNTSSREIKFIPTAAIPIYARGANNLRDHRHVTSLLNRVFLHKYGVVVKPTLSFDEAGHKPNNNIYFVLGFDEKSLSPQFIYPTQEMFCQDGGDLEAPESILSNLLPDKNAKIQGKEAMGALRFKSITLKPGETHSYIITMGIIQDEKSIDKLIRKFNTLSKVNACLLETKKFWGNISSRISLETGNNNFDNWFHWVNIQPLLRSIFGCSFLPDFDYGKGGRGWRDLWQDALSLILNSPKQVRKLLINNFSGVRIDGSNATIIGKDPQEFIADRNDIARVWMDHGVWPLISLDLYINETGDQNILFEQTSYFRDQHIFRSQRIDKNWNPLAENKLKTNSGKIYKGSILEHLLIENLVQFFNVGAHNHIRLEGADWNDGLDMAEENGESVAFSCMYARNLKLLSQQLKKLKIRKVKIAKELKILLKKTNYNDIKAKQKTLQEYFNATKQNISGLEINIEAFALARDLEEKSEWMIKYIRKSEWLPEGFFNGYYDNRKEQVEGKKKGIMGMMLESQVFPIMSDVARDWQIDKILKSARKYLFDKKNAGWHLNTDFKRELKTLGRAFSFSYGDKENGAFFNHMNVIFAFGLYKKGYAKEGWAVLSSVYNMAVNTEKSKIYPCLPEYFNLEGRGMYSYLTGSASWFILTLLTEAFGLKGSNGNLMIEPKLCSAQFKYSSNIMIMRSFRGKRIKVSFFNPRKLDYGKYKIIKASLNSKPLLIKGSSCVEISRKIISGLPKNKENSLNIILG